MFLQVSVILFTGISGISVHGGRVSVPGGLSTGVSVWGRSLSWRPPVRYASYWNAFLFCLMSFFVFRVDDVWRLPNFDLCLPGYNPSRWRHLAHIQSRTFSVLDLKSLCSEMGRSAGMGTSVRDVRVRERERERWFGLLHIDCTG